MDPEGQLTAEPPPLSSSELASGGAMGDVRNSSTIWTSVNVPGNNCSVYDATSEDAMSDAQAELRVDQHNALHVDTTDDRVYDTSTTQDGGHYRLPTEKQPAKLAMRKHLKLLLPRELVQDEFGTVVSLDEVSSQHLAKLQGKVWRELPLMVAMTADEVEGDITTECIIAVQSVYYIAELLSKMNSVFILHPRSMQPCHSALCQHVHEKLKKPYSKYEVTLEPLVDWMTLDPVCDVTTLWLTFFRRNKSLLHKFSLTNSKFIPHKPVRFCLECLAFIAGERNLAWGIINEEPDIIHADVPMPWPMPGSNEDGKKSEEMSGKKSSEEPWSSDSGSGDSSSCSSEDTVKTSQQATDREPPIPTVDGAFDCKAKPRFTKFEIWRDPRPDPECEREHSTQVLQLPLSLQEGQTTDQVGWAVINSPGVPSTVANDPVQLSVDTGRHFGDELDCNLGVQGSCSFVPLPSLETTDSAIETTDSDLEADDSDLEIIGTDNNATKSDMETVTSTNRPIEPRKETVMLDMNPGYDLVPRPHTPHNSFTNGDFTWPAPKESVSPVPARPAPGFDTTPKYLYPYPNQLICLCKQPAKTGTVRIVQCKNPECFVRWYHYACLKDRSEKGVARFGTLLCELCKGEEHWGKAQEQNVTDLSMPFSQKEVVDGIMGGGAGDPYGLGGN